MNLADIEVLENRVKRFMEKQHSISGNQHEEK